MSFIYLFIFFCKFICLYFLIPHINDVIQYFSFSFVPSFFFFSYCSGFFHTLTWISLGFTCVPHPEPPSCLLLHPIPLGLPNAPALSTCLMHPTWLVISALTVYLFQCYSLGTPHPRLLPQSPKACSVHLCLFFCFAYRVSVTIFLNSIYMC